MTPDEIKEARIHKRRLARMRFKSFVRKVAANRIWLSEIEETSMGENVRRNVAIIVRKKGPASILTLSEKSLFNTPFHCRTEAQRKAILQIVQALKCFANYQPTIRSRLAKVLYFLHYNPGRTILREGHHASAMYFIVEGEVLATKKTYDKINDKWYDDPFVAYTTGEMFGEVSLLLNRKRTATVTTAVATELLCVYKDDFDAILKETLQSQWDQIMLSLKRFEYFKAWTPEQILECCVMSKISQYSPLQTIYAEDSGRLNFVFFVLSGTCMILQCLKMNYKPNIRVKNYELDPIEQVENSESEKLINKINMEAEKMRHTIAVGPAEQLNPTEQSAEIVCDSKSKPNPEKAQDIDFVDVGRYSAGSVFGLGEEMEHRSIVAHNFVQCLLIPRFWLFQKNQNQGNVWQRTKIYLNSSVPSRQKIFDDYMSTTKWRAYKDKVVKDLRTQQNIKNQTTVEDVPIICRIDNGF